MYSDVTAKTGDNVNFTVKAEGVGLTYQWQYKKAGAASWSNWSGRTATSTTAAANATWNGMQIRCVVKNSVGTTVNSNAAKITLSDALAITTQPMSKTINLGDSVTLSLKAQGSGLTYQWYFKKTSQTSFNVWNEHTHASETCTPNASWNGMQLYCIVKDSAGHSVKSNTVTVTVNSPGITITQQPQNQSIIAGKPLTLSVKATGSSLKYQWYFKKKGQTSFTLWNGRTSAVVKDCSFTGFVRVDNGTMYSKEAIHLDFLPFDDGTRFPTKNAAVESCTFDSVASGVGTHNYGNGSYETGITVTGCTFKDVIYNCVNAYCMKDLSVSGCYAENCGSFLRMCDSVGTFTSNIVQGSGPRCYSMLEGSSATVRQCELSGVGSIKEVDDGEPTNVQKTIGLFVLDSGCIIENNELSDILGVGIMVKNGNAKSVINGNTISGVTEHGIYFSDAGATGKRIEIADNTLSDCQGILLDYGESLVTGNTLNGCTNGIVVWCGSSQITSNTVSNSTEYGIRVNGTENQKGSADIESNIITGSGSDDLRIEAYCSGCVVKNNNTSGEFRFTYSLRAGIVASGNGIHPLPETPALTCTASGTRIALNWNPCERAVEYIIYSFDPDKQTKKQLAFTKDTQYLIAGLAQNTEYSFLVVCRDEASNYSFYTYPTNVVSAVTGVYEELQSGEGAG